MRQKITEEIENFVTAYGQRPEIRNTWGTPLVGFAGAYHPEMARLKQTVLPDHVMPWEVLEQPTVVICYFLPFQKELAETNWGGDTASPEWALAYEETNALFGELNAYLIQTIAAWGYRAAATPEAGAFDRERLRSRWSQRHIARIAGLGTFGVNNMLITKAGCCGRYSSVVTDLPVTPDQPLTEEYCLYKKNGNCGQCVKQCPSGALTLDGFDRQTCFALCRKNARLLPVMGNSYAAVAGQEAAETGSEVCGKCEVHMPCSFRRG